MPKYMLSFFLTLLSISAIAQDDKIPSNGHNLQAYCSTEACKYLNFEHTIYYPSKENREWEMQNMELSTNRNGGFIATGDLYVYGVDTAAVISYDIIFYSASDELLYTHQVVDFEFYNEGEWTDPMFTLGKMDVELARQVDYFNIDITASRRVPYYEISSDCYSACKDHEFSEAIKTFKKTK